MRIARLLTPDDATARRTALDAWLGVAGRLSQPEADEPPHLAVLRATIETLAERVAPDDGGAAYAPEAFEPEGDRWAGWWREDRMPREWDQRPRDEALTRALAQLNPGTALVVVLREVEGLSPNEVEHLLGLAPHDQRALLHVGLAAVWKALA